MIKRGLRSSSYGYIAYGLELISLQADCPAESCFLAGCHFNFEKDNPAYIIKPEDNPTKALSLSLVFNFWGFKFQVGGRTTAGSTAWWPASANAHPNPTSYAIAAPQQSLRLTHTWYILVCTVFTKLLQGMLFYAVFLLETILCMRGMYAVVLETLNQCPYWCPPYMTLFWYILRTYCYVLVCMIIHFLYKYDSSTYLYVQVRTSTYLIPCSCITVHDSRCY